MMGYSVLLKVDGGRFGYDLVCCLNSRQNLHLFRMIIQQIGENSYHIQWDRIGGGNSGALG
ncbi:hypothetical protein B9T07_17640 [Limnospira fusiformis CCALA 023]|nr:hypothetical protein AP285_19645 [Arthrospira platensis YZ]KDR54190.1 hypothetical protein APPUASWS_029350 [Arthrospira platensis str. Paraca]